MASINDYNDKYWRAIISDRPRHPKPKQIYYPKNAFTKKKALVSAEILELRHKKGELNLWNMKVQVFGNEVLIRQLEGKGSMLFSHVYEQMMKQARKELSPGSIRTYTGQYNSIMQQLGDFYPSSINADRVNEFVNSGKYSTRKLRKAFLNKVFEFGHKKYGLTHPVVEIQSTKAERNEYLSMDYKTFLTEYEVLTLAHHAAQKSRWKQPVQTAYLILVLFYFPRRISDVLNLKKDWVQSRVVQIGDSQYKTKLQKEELVAPTQEAMQLLHLVKNSFINTEKFIFNLNGKTFYLNFRKLTDKVMPDVSKKISPHKLRDSGIMYLLYEKKLTTPDVMSITGHGELSSLQRYIHRGGAAIMKQKKDKNTVDVMLQLKKKFFEGIIINELTG